MNILVIGGGGREHAICWKLKQSKRVEKIYCIPGNGGISEIAECHPEISAVDLDEILNFINTHSDIKFTVVAPDDPLALGLVDLLEKNGHRAFGPKKDAAIIESSKVFSKNLMKKYGIPTAAYETFDEFTKAQKYCKSAKYPIVVKADGLALGKGVIICQNLTEAENALTDLMQNKVFGNSGNKVVIEEFLKGTEVSILAFTDGQTIIPMVSSKDYKRAFDGDLGLNTGGMGNFSPSNVYTDEHAKFAYSEIFLKTMNALNAESRKFKGVIYFGLMIDGKDIKVLEYNARFGDPETQVILPRLKNDLLEIFESIVDEKLKDIKIEWDDGVCVCVVLASKGYPQSYKKELKIEIKDLDKDILLFHAGTKILNGSLVTNGGRVLNVCAMAKTIKEAREKIYNNIEKISFEGMFYRTDIAKL
ncbi:MAG: phosphoribosylamine--glycine ligase [Firmicutes bacterium]|nr:phosphoribosylamine--glycine ligase [Bacillota bacterium]